MRHILMFAMILGLTLGFASYSHAGKDEPTPVIQPSCDPKKENCDDDGKGDGEEEVVCDPKKENCDDDGKGGGEVSGSWHGYKPGSKELEQAKAEMEDRRKQAAPEVQQYLKERYEARENEVRNKK